MVRRPLPALGAQELAIMKVVWRLKDASVRDVYETLRERRSVAYTTVMTMMNTLETKGYLKKHLDGRAFRYQPAVPEQRVVGAMVREFVERVFDGGSAALLAHLVSESDLTDEEREELRRLIDEAKRCSHYRSPSSSTAARSSSWCALRHWRKCSFVYQCQRLDLRTGAPSPRSVSRCRSFQHRHPIFRMYLSPLALCRRG
jgi:BlaI family transcriptional regulator, penicillinase repressor